MQNSYFEGPLFIVGMPRSGTKLVRSLLNNHSKISLPNFETHFIPPFLKKFGKGDNDLLLLKNFFIKTKFYTNVQNQYGGVESIEFHESKIETTNFIELILKYYSGGNIKNNTISSSFIWGDKTPLYIKKLEIIDEFFPGCKIIHVVRDPRDICLSYKKTWSKNIYNTAEKWREVMEISSKYKFKSEKLIEVKYEELTINTEESVKKICEFIGIKFEKNMISLSKPVEKFGDVQKREVTRNSNKFLSSFSSKEIENIESIVKKYLNNYDYKLIHQDVTYRPLSKIYKYLFTIIDHLSLLIHIYKYEGGFIEVYRSMRSQILRKIG